MLQADLFAPNGPQTLINRDGKAVLYKRWLTGTRELFIYLYRQLAWEQTFITLYGRQVAIARLNAWYGDPHSVYTYSGVRFTPHPWLGVLSELREQLEAYTGTAFNSVLANLYRHGSDSVAWHSDDEPELGPQPVIASLSLGATRRFSLRHKRDRSTLGVDLADGDLLIMSGALQQAWQHQLGKTRKPCSPRINLTFRKVGFGA